MDFDFWRNYIDSNAIYIYFSKDDGWFWKKLFFIIVLDIKNRTSGSLHFSFEKIFTFGGCVLVGITLTEIVFGVVYFIFLNYMFKKFKNNDDYVVLRE